MNLDSLLVACIIGTAAVAPAAHARTTAQPASLDAGISANEAETVTASGPKKLLDTYILSKPFGALPLFPGYTVVDSTVVNCPNNAATCTIGFESMAQLIGDGTVVLLCMRVDSLPYVCQSDTLTSGGTPALAHTREAVENLAPGPHTVQTAIKVVTVNQLFFLQSEYHVYKP